MFRPALLPIALAVVGCSPDAPVPQAAATAPAIEAKPLAVNIGVLEDRPGATTAEQPRFIVRALFQKDKQGWRSLEPECTDLSCLASAPTDFPASVDWTVVHHGGTRGSVRATTPAAWQLYADVGSQEIAAGVTPPVIGERSMEFAGGNGVPIYRPLLAVSAPEGPDADSWKAAEVSPKAVAAIRVAFRGLFANVLNCANEGAVDARPVTYADRDVTISKGAAAKTGCSVATANLTGYRCDGPWDDTAFAPQAFAVSPDGDARYLGEGLQFLDASDFDGDGKSEVVFAITGANQGGYQLRYNDFAAQAVFAFSYH
jgi:hypothetical protein